jgi:tetratricopeptide (TPR) repeat protein
MSAELARNPDSLVFLDLGEALRVRGQLHAAVKTTTSGLERHPQLADAHDLYARVLVDMGHLERATEEWQTAIELEPRHLGAHKGIGFLSYRWGDLDSALEHLELALAADPMDPSVVQALGMVRDAAASAAAGDDDLEELGPQMMFEGLEGAEHGLLLVDPRGRVLGGGIHDSAGTEVTADVAAHMAAGCQEAERAARMLELGTWQAIVVEGQGGNMHVSRPMDEALLLVARDRSVPAGRLAMLASRAAGVARRWVEAQQP